MESNFQIQNVEKKPKPEQIQVKEDLLLSCSDQNQDLVQNLLKENAEKTKLLKEQMEISIKHSDLLNQQIKKINDLELQNKILQRELTN